MTALTRHAHASVATPAAASATTTATAPAAGTRRPWHLRAEDVVGEQRLDAHEESGERFLILSGVVFAISALGLLAGAPGRGARAVATVATLGLLVAGYQVGHSGGNLVYGDGTSPGVSQLSAGGGEAAGQGGERDNADADDD